MSVCVCVCVCVCVRVCVHVTAGEMIISNERYSMNENESSMYAVQMTLVIRKLHKADMGGYKCISKNSIGDAEGTIRLYGEFGWKLSFLGSFVNLILRLITFLSFLRYYCLI